MKSQNTHTNNRIKKGLLTLLTLWLSACAFGQTNPTDSIPDDPAAVVVRNIQPLSFGAFTNGGAGGTVSISTNGTRTVSGSIVPLNMGTFFYQAIFDISAPQGVIISILFGPDATLTGNHGGSMSMHLSGSSPPSPFVTTALQPQRTPVNISGTLSVGSSAANPPGAYSGTFYITFNHE